MKKVSDIVAEFLATNAQVANDVFLVSGGGNMHLIDSVGRHEKLRYICNHHEQACAIAAEGYARVTNKIGVALVTTGPGGTNAITGVYGAWVDSIPTLTISGQVKFETTIASQPELKLRQLGDQEINIVDLVKPITKYAVMVTDKNDILYHLEKAVYEARNGRPGPVWIDIPLDIQGTKVDPNELKHFSPPKVPEYDLHIDEVITLLKQAKRPVIIVGNGVRLASSVSTFHSLVDQLNIPVVTAISGVDLIESSHHLFFGRPGILGERAANFIVQNADLLLILGSRLNLRIISFNWEYFAREATKIMVDIDPNELSKKTIKPNLPILADLKPFIETLLKRIKYTHIPKYDEWLQYCKRIKKHYPIFDKHNLQDHFVSSYYFPILLSKYLPIPSTIVTGNGIAYTSTYQAYPIRKGDRLFANVGCAAMGYDLPAAIGACVAYKKEVICITGDGSIQMNLQEMQTIIHNQLPIKIFMYNNNGYLSIRITQKNYFSGHFVGESAQSGISLPDMKKVAKVYGFKVYTIANNKEAEEKLPKILREKGPVFCEVLLDSNEEIGPKVASYKKPDGTIVSKPLEDLSPFLPREEFLSNMIIEPIKDA